MNTGITKDILEQLMQHSEYPCVSIYTPTDPGFHITPLLPLTTEDGHFFVLALSQNRVRLFEATLHAVKELSLENVPGSLAEALRFDEEQSQLQFHTISTGTQGGGGASQFHGQGVGIDNSKNQLLRYFQQIDNGLSSRLNAEKAPLILAAVDYLHPIYEEANHYQNLVTGRLTGNPDQLSAEAFHSEAVEVVKPMIRAKYARHGRLS